MASTLTPTREEQEWLERFAEWLLREHTIVTDWTTDGRPSAKYQRPTHMVMDFLQKKRKF